MQQHRWWAAIPILLVAFFLLINTIPAMYMREDEEIAFRSTTGRTLQYTVWFQATQDIHAPTWFSAFWLWQQFMGDSEYMGRVHSILWSMLTLSVMYRIGCSAFGKVRYGLFTVLALAVNAYFTLYALEIRPYAMVLLAAASSMWTLYRWLKHPTPRRAIFYGLTLAWILYLHYFMVFLLIAQAVYVLLFHHLNWRMLRQITGAVLLALGMWLPWLPVFAHQILTLRRIEAASLRAGIGISSTTEPTTLEAILTLVGRLTNHQIVLAVLVIALGVFLLRRTPNYRLALMWGIGLPALIFAANFFAAVYTPRYLTYSVLGVGLVFGAALAALPARWRFVGLAGFLAMMLWGLPGAMPDFYPPYRTFLQTVSTLAKPGDIYYEVDGSRDNFVLWQHRHYLSEDLRSHIVYSAEETLSSRRIWHVTSRILEPDVQAEFHMIEQTHPVQFVLGECTRRGCYVMQLMEAPPLTEPVLLGGQINFMGADIDRVSSEQINTRLWWQQETRVELDYSLGLYLVDSGGVVLAQQDGPINHYGNEIVQTSHLEPGRIYIDHRAIDVRSVPPGHYTLSLAVYQWWDGVRLITPNGADQIMLGEVVIR